MDEILWCYHSNETSSAVLSHVTIYLVCSSNFWICGWKPMVLPFKWNLFSSTFTCYYHLVCRFNFYICGSNPAAVHVLSHGIILIFCFFSKWIIYKFYGFTDFPQNKHPLLTFDLSHCWIRWQFCDHVTRELPLNSTPAAHSLKDQHLN